MTQQKETNSDDILGFRTTANQLTALRMLLVPAVVICMQQDRPLYDLIATGLFGIAAITDYFDGYFARTQKNVTVMGQLIDPLADKFLVASALIMLQELGRLHPWVVIILICREFAISGLRALAGSEGIVIPASPLAKWKTATQMAGIPMIMANRSLGINLIFPGQVIIYISILVSLWSLKDYVVDFFRTLAKQRAVKREQKRQKKEAKRMAKKAARIQKFLEKNPDLEATIKDVMGKKS